MTHIIQELVSNSRKISESLEYHIDTLNNILEKLSKDNETDKVIDKVPTLRRSTRNRQAPIHHGELITGEDLEKVFSTYAVFIDKKPSKGKKEYDLDNIRHHPFIKERIETIGVITGLSKLNSETMFEFFAKYADDEGYLSRQVYYSSFKKMFKTYGKMNGYKNVENFVDKWFVLNEGETSPFGKIEFTTLVGGLVLFCQGSSLEKVESCQYIYDFTHNRDRHFVCREDCQEWVKDYVNLVSLLLPSSINNKDLDIKVDNFWKTIKTYDIPFSRMMSLY
jgi:hypothetical protein